ncbi:DUF2218 domain-containing protein [Marinobacter salarius]|uniref:DUF2218 domain-containing protein n=1 Tax=Marinobacter TaxID=2742 RepID=UPI001D18682A|nr:DUF2218 domain-containing protein [Marinobacter salarius]MCC4284161.1 DUF2218 domain-containing protein [Marinobacter salarius]MDP4534401.1 DUF2218 domain-containing protein [Marinobacter salarius]
MKTRTAHVLTPNADRYIARLCRHFSHKVPASWEKQQGEIRFPMGTCHLHASDTTLRLRSDANDNNNLEQLCQVVGSHLERFAAGAKEAEELTVVWGETSDSGTEGEATNG